MIILRYFRSLNQKNKFIYKFILVIILALTLFLFIGQRNSTPVKYDSSEIKFLEDATGERARNWAESRTKITKEHFKSLSVYASINHTVKEILYDKNKLLRGSIHKGYVYNFWTDEVNPQGLWRRASVAEYEKDLPEWETLIDFDVMSKKMGKKVMCKGIYRCPTHDQSILVSLSFGGNDETIFQEWNLETKQFVDGGFQSKNTKGEWIGGKFTSGLWFDENSILCNVVLDPKHLTNSLYPNTLYLWKRGTPVEQAKKIFEIPSSYMIIGFSRLLDYETHPSLFYISAWKDFYNSDHYILDDKLTPQKIKMPSDSKFEGSFKEYVFFSLRSDWNAGYKKGSVVAMYWRDLLKDDKEKSTLFAIYTPQEREAFDSLAITNDTVFLSIFNNINSEVYKLTLQGNKWEKKAITLPNKIASIGITADQYEEQALMFFENPLTPPSVYIWNKNKEFTQIRKPIHEFDSQNYIAEQRHAISSDGQKIPYYISYKKGLILDGKNPTILTAYGGFQVINSPYYSNFHNKVWLNNGGVCVTANIRGGGEFGPDWHTAAIQDKRQTGFDDFIAVAKDVIQCKITSPEHLGIIGGSNGGLLVSVAMTQHPELFGAVVCAVPIADMIRYTEFGAGPSWVAEYGDPKDPKISKYLEGYSPIQNIYKGKKYPPLFITSAANDQRVHPWHARILKYLMEKAGYKNIYFIESEDAGHGAGADLNDKIDYYSTIYSFLANMLRLEVR